MRKIIFDSKDPNNIQIKGDESISLIELLQISIKNCPKTDFSKSEFKTLSRLKKKLRLLNPKLESDPQNLILEEDEFKLLTDLFEATSKITRVTVAEEVAEIFEIFEHTVFYTS